MLLATFNYGIVPGKFLMTVTSKWCKLSMMPNGTDMRCRSEEVTGVTHGVCPNDEAILNRRRNRTSDNSASQTLRMARQPRLADFSDRVPKRRRLNEDVGAPVIWMV